MNIKRFKLILYIFLLVNFFFWIGFHNTDICHNIIVINEQFDLNLGESNLLIDFIEPVNCYMSGLNFMIAAFILMSFLIVYSFNSKIG